MESKSGRAMASVLGTRAYNGLRGRIPQRGPGAESVPDKGLGTPSDVQRKVQTAASIIPPPKRLCFYLCLSVCLLTGLLKNYTDQIFMKFYGVVGLSPGPNNFHCE